jgi:hypothetical protein
MIDFKKFYKHNILLKEAEDKHIGKKAISHLEHLEDLLLIDGPKGVTIFSRSVKELLDEELLKKGEVKLSLKIDGSPAIFFGIDPDDKKFFVATKSFLNINPLMVKSVKDAKNIYGSKSKDLLEKIISAWRNLSKLKINPNFIYQCDLLFSEKSKSIKTLDGENYLTYMPNTLMYAVPVDNKSELFQRVNKANFGMAVHTKYTFKKDGKRFFLNQTSPIFDDLSKQEKSSGVFIEDVLLQGKNLENVNFSNKDSILKELNYIDNIKDSINLKPLDKFINLKTSIKIFLNRQLDKPGYGLFGDAIENKQFNYKKFEYQLKEHIDGEFEKKKSKLKTDNGKKSLDSKKLEWFNYIENNRNDISEFFSLYYKMIKVKNLLIQDLNNLDSKIGKVFVKDGEDFRRGAEEGYVLINDRNVIKIVDRIEFSRLNRLSRNF